MKDNKKWFLPRWEVSTTEDLKEFLFSRDDSSFRNSLGADEDRIFNLDLRPEEKHRLKQIRKHLCDDCNVSPPSTIVLCDTRMSFLRSLSPVARNMYSDRTLTYALYFAEKTSLVRTLWEYETNKFVSEDATFSCAICNCNLPSVATLQEMSESDAMSSRRKVLFCQFSQGGSSWFEQICTSLDDPSVSVYYCKIEELQAPSLADKNPLKHIFDSSLWDFIILQIPRDGRMLIHDTKGRLGRWTACATFNLKKRRNVRLGLSLIIKDDPYSNDDSNDEVMSLSASESMIFDETAQSIFVDGIFSFNSTVPPGSKRFLCWRDMLSRPKLQKLQNWDAISEWSWEKAPITSVFVADQSKTVIICQK